MTSDPLCQVEGIPENQLKIASLGKARMEKGYPSAKKLISQGVPSGLAAALAPFQRGGVDFVIDKGGRALIADGMSFIWMFPVFVVASLNLSVCILGNMGQIWGLER